VSWDVGPELRALATLCKELQIAGIGSEMRDSIPGVAVRTSMPCVYLYVFISTTGEQYVWQTNAMQHPISDAAGAAQQIKTFMTESGAL
jgi:hypothetical protein